MLAARPWAVAVAVTVHLMLVAWLWLASAVPPSGAVATGSGGLELALEPAGSAAGATTPSEATMLESVAEPETLTARTEVAEVVAAPPVTLAAATEASEASEVTAPAAALPPVIDQAALREPDRAAVATATLVPAAARVPTVTATEPVSPRPPKPAARPVPSPPTAAPAGASGKSGTTDAPDSGSGDRSAGGGEVGAARDYLATLAAWLERHKQYPQQARFRGEEGTVLLRFTIDRTGRLLSWRIDRGSGSAALDREVGTMLERAEPLPPMPPAMAQAQLELAVPIRFRLR